MGELLSLYGLTTFDAIAILIIIVMAIVGFAKGFVRELGNLIATIGSFIVAKIVAIQCYPLVMTKFNAEEEIRLKLTEVVSGIDTSTVDSAREGLMSQIYGIKGIGNLLRNIPIEHFEITDLIQKNDGADISSDLVEILYSKIEPLLENFFYVFTFVAAFIVLFIVLSIVMKLLAKLIESIAFIGTANTLLGGVIGIIKGIILIAVLFSLLYVIFTFTDSGMLDTFTSSKLFSLVGTAKEYLIQFR